MNIDEATLQAAVAKALVENVSPEIQSGIFAKAVQDFLFAKAGYDSKETTLSKTFQRALEGAAYQVARDYLQLPAVKEKIDQQVHQCLDKVLDSDEFRTTLTEKLLRSIKW